MEFISEELKFGLKAVQAACKVTRKIQKELAAGEMKKKDRSPVTVGDFTGQAIVGKLFAEHFPDGVLIGEEGSEMLKLGEGKDILDKVVSYVKTVIPEANSGKVCEWIDQGNGVPSETFWTLDPIDGTKGFMRGEQYAVGLSFIKKDSVELGIIGCPNLSISGQSDYEGEGCLMVAQKGEGTWVSSLAEPLNFKRVYASDQKNVKEMKILRSVESKHTHVGRTVNFMKDLGVEAEPIYMDSQAKYVMVAMGFGESFFYLVPENRPNYRMKIWDVAPGAIVVEEAGGHISDLEGKTIDYSAGVELKNNPGLVISNGHLHDNVLQGLKNAAKN